MHVATVIISNAHANEMKAKVFMKEIQFESPSHLNLWSLILHHVNSF